MHGTCVASRKTPQGGVRRAAEYPCQSEPPTFSALQHIIIKRTKFLTLGIFRAEITSYWVALRSHQFVPTKLTFQYLTCPVGLSSHSSIMVPPATKPQYPSSPQDWVKHKSEIVELYDRNELKDVMLHMEQHHNFRAT